MSKQGALAAASGQERATRVGILGGTFDPVHYAHLAIAEEVYYRLKLEHLLFVPAGHPPHKAQQAITATHHRLAMLKLALASNPHFRLSLVDLQRPGPSYTVETLRLLRQEWGSRVELYFIIGSDSLKDLPTWHDPAGILNQAMIVALVRPGIAAESDMRAKLEARLPTLHQRLLMLDGPGMDISSTELRQRAAEGRPIKYQLPEAVEKYILQHHLYQSTPDI